MNQAGAGALASGNNGKNELNSNNAQKDHVSTVANDFVQILKHIRVNDSNGANVIANHAKSIVQVHFYPNQSHSNGEMNAIFGELLQLSDDVSQAQIQIQLLEFAEYIYGDNHIVISDIFTAVSKAKIKMGRLSEALEYSGRALLIRMKTSGLLDEKTADSHYNLGLIYRLLGEYANSRKELMICRNIRVKVYGLTSLAVANCDLSIGQTEKAASCAFPAYFYFYNCYRTRMQLLGADHPQSLAALQMVENCQFNNGERLYCSMELKERVMKLKWNEGDSSERTYAISVYINKLQYDEVLQESHLKALVMKAIKFAQSRSNNDDRGTSTKVLFDQLYHKLTSDLVGDENVIPEMQTQLQSPGSEDLKSTKMFVEDSPQIDSGSGNSPQSTQISTPNNNPNSGVTMMLNAENLRPVDYSRQTTQSPDDKTVVFRRRSYLSNIVISKDGNMTSPSANTGSNNTTPAKTGIIGESLAGSGTPTATNSASIVTTPSSGRRRSILTEIKSQKALVVDPVVDNVNASSSDRANQGGTSATELIFNNTNFVANVESNNNNNLNGNNESSLTNSNAAMKNTPNNDYTQEIAAYMAVTPETTVPFHVEDMTAYVVKDLDGNRVSIRRENPNEVIRWMKKGMKLVGELKVEMASGVTAAKSSEPQSNESVKEGMSSAKSALNALFKNMGPKLGPPKAENADASTSKASTTNKESALATGPIVPSEAPPRPPPLPASWPPIPHVIGETLDAAIASGASKTPGQPPGPKIKTVALDKIESIENTLWEESIESLVAVDELFQDIEDEFVVAVKKKTPAKPAATAATTSKANKGPQGVLDPQRAQNVSIMLAKFGKRSITDIVKAVAEVDYASLGNQAVNALLQYLPTSEESTLLREAEAKANTSNASESDSSATTAATQPPKLGKAEQYLLEMSKVTNPEKKLNVMTACLSAPETQQNTSRSSEAIIRAVNEIRGSTRLKYIFKTYLDLSNILIQKAKTPGSTVQMGFKLSSLSKLTQTKTNSGDTVEQYVISRIYDHVPQALELAGDFQSLDDAKQVIFQRLRSDISRLELGIATMKELINDENESNEVKDKLNRCIDECTRILTKSTSALKDAESEFAEILRYLGEDPCDPEQLFAQIQKFVSSVETATSNAIAKSKKKAKQTTK